MRAALGRCRSPNCKFAHVCPVLSIASVSSASSLVSTPEDRVRLPSPVPLISPGPSAAYRITLVSAPAAPTMVEPCGTQPVSVHLPVPHCASGSPSCPSASSHVTAGSVIPAIRVPQPVLSSGPPASMQAYTSSAPSAAYLHVPPDASPLPPCRMFVDLFCGWSRWTCCTALASTCSMTVPLRSSAL